MSKKTRKKSRKPVAARPIRKSAAKAAAKPKSRSSKKVAKKAKRGRAKPPAANNANTKTKAAKSTRSKAAKTAAAPARKGTTLTEGGAAPSFRLPRDGGTTVSLADFAGRKLVIFFYPRADTPGCTLEAVAFSRLSDAFAASGAAVLGVSADSLAAQESFHDKHQLSVPLISDEKQTMLKAYGVWGEKSMYGRTFMGILRTTVLIDAAGKIARIWHNVKVDGHADEVLAAARTL